MLEASLRRSAILRGAFSDIEAEFKTLVSFLGERKIGHLTDIGCGHAFIDTLFHKRYGCSLHLVDIEQTSETHHLYRETGSGYANLQSARRLLEANGVPPESIRTTNPQKGYAPETASLVISLLSCGFHYPAETYASTFEMSELSIIDLRKDSGQEGFLERFHAEPIVEGLKHVRYALTPR